VLSSGVGRERKAYPRAKAPFFAVELRPKAEALRYLDATTNSTTTANTNATANATTTANATASAKATTNAGVLRCAQNDTGSEGRRRGGGM